MYRWITKKADIPNKEEITRLFNILKREIAEIITEGISKESWGEIDRLQKECY